MAEITLATPITVMGESVAVITVPAQIKAADLWDFELNGGLTIGKIMALAGKVAAWRTSDGDARVGIPVASLRQMQADDAGALVDAMSPLLCAFLTTGARSAPT